MRTAVIAAVTFCASQSPGPLNANVCVEPGFGNWYWGGYSEIVVYIHPNLAENLEHSEGIPWNQAELREAIESALLSFQESMAVGIPRIRVASGYSTVNWNQYMGPGTIHVTTHLDNNCPVGSAYQHGGPGTGAVIAFHRSGTGFVNGNNLGLDDCNDFQTHYSDARVFRGTFNHELMHCFGNKHPGVGSPACDAQLSCPAYPAYTCSCGADSAVNVETSWNCHKHDQKRLQDAGHGLWASANATERHREWVDGLPWRDLSGPPVHAPWPGLSSSSLPYMFMARRHPSNVNTFVQLYRWVYTTQDWEPWGFVQGSAVTSLGTVDVAYGGAPAYPFIGHAGVQSVSDPLRELYFTKMTAAGNRTRWTMGSDATPIDGVGIAREPGAGYYIVVWRDDALRIKVQRATSTGTFGPVYQLEDVGGAPEVAAEAPSIDCGPSSIGAHPCVLAWAAPIPNGGGGCCQLLKWVHLGIDANGNFTRGNILQQGISLLGPPHVAYKGPDGANTAFVLAHRNVSNENYYTIGKPVGEVTFWDTTTLEAHPSGVGSYTMTPGIGSAGGAYELLEQSR